jgi:hypothetical protein
VSVAAGTGQRLCASIHCRRCPAHATLDFILARPGEVPPDCRRLLSFAATRHRMAGCSTGSLRRTPEAAALLPHGWGYAEVVAALDTRRLVALDTAILPTIRVPTGPRTTRKEEPPAPVEEAEKILTWIGIELLGEDCRPLAGERYRVESPSGSVFEGRLDGGGRARIDDMDPGECRILFPDLDQDAWTADTRCPDVLPPVRKPVTTYIGIELVDMAGHPVPNERYVITLPDGSRHEGRLDGSGQAKIDGIAEGDCAISFPMLDEECWEAQEA